MTICWKLDQVIRIIVDQNTVLLASVVCLV